jgi:hypothetical protein
MVSLLFLGRLVYPFDSLGNHPRPRKLAISFCNALWAGGLYDEWCVITYISLIGSSEESVGGVGLRQIAEGVIKGNFSDAEGAESVSFSHGELGLVVWPRRVLAIFFIGSMRERMTWSHQSSRNFAAQAGELYCQNCWKSSLSR